PRGIGDGRPRPGAALFRRIYRRIHFYLASRKIEFLTIHPVASGVLYGIAVYTVMYWLVLPMAFPTFRHRMWNELLAVAIHISLIGLPCALIVRRYSQQMRQSS